MGLAALMAATVDTTPSTVSSLVTVVKATALPIWATLPEAALTPVVQDIMFPEPAVVMT